MRRERSARFHRRSNRPRDQGVAREGPRGVVDHHHVGLLGEVPKCIGDRVLAAVAADDDHERLADSTQILGRRGRDVGRHGNDDRIHLGMREERRNASLEDRSPADRQQLLGTRRTQALTAPTGRNDGGDIHPS